MNNQKIITALNNFNAAVLELSNVLDETGYTLVTAPDFLQSPDDFAYTIGTFVEDEKEELTEE